MKNREAARECRSLKDKYQALILASIIEKEAGNLSHNSTEQGDEGGDTEPSLM